MSKDYWTEALLKRVAKEVDKAYAAEAVAAPNADLVNLVQPMNRSGFPVPLGKSARLWIKKVVSAEGERIVLAVHMRVERGKDSPDPLKAPDLSRSDHLKQVKQKERSTLRNTEWVMPLVKLFEERWTARAEGIFHGTDLLTKYKEDKLLRLELQGLEQYGLHLAVVMFTIEVLQEVRALHLAVLQAGKQNTKRFAAALKEAQESMEARAAAALEEQMATRKKLEKKIAELEDTEDTAVLVPERENKLERLRRRRDKLEHDLQRSQNESYPGWCSKLRSEDLTSVAQLLRIRIGWPFLFSRLQAVVAPE